jgi:hypothetical protein
MKNFIALLVVVATCLLAGCFFRAIQEADVVGEYQASLPDGGTETLELVEAGKCTQVIRLKTGEVYEAVGTWKLSPQRGRPYLIFKGIRSTLTGFEKINPKIAEPPYAVVGKDVTPSWTGKPMINFTEGTYYRKIR